MLLQVWFTQDSCVFSSPFRHVKVWFTQDSSVFSSPFKHVKVWFTLSSYYINNNNLVCEDLLEDKQCNLMKMSSFFNFESDSLNCTIVFC